MYTYCYVIKEKSILHRNNNSNNVDIKSVLILNLVGFRRRFFSKGLTQKFLGLSILTIAPKLVNFNRILSELCKFYEMISFKNIFSNLSSSRTNGYDLMAFGKSLGQVTESRNSNLPNLLYLVNMI